MRYLNVGFICATSRCHRLRYNNLLQVQRDILISRSGYYLISAYERLPPNYHTTTKKTVTELTQKNVSREKANQYIVKALYRQLVRWCQKEERDSSSRGAYIPLHYYVPPIHLTTPQQIDSYRMELLASLWNSYKDNSNVGKMGTLARTLLSSKSEIKPTHLTVPVHTVSDLKQFFQFIFRLNNSTEPESIDNVKPRIAEAFDALKSLNELSAGKLSTLEEKRKRSRNRENVTYKVGHVVRHKVERWRGVIADWERESNKNNGLSDDFRNVKTSLTTKIYTLDDSLNIRYNLIVDDSDAYSMNIVTGRTSAVQSDLEPIEDYCLCRIRSRHIEDHFTRYNNVTHSFVPNALKAYLYPDDQEAIKADQYISPEAFQLSMEIINGVKELAERLEYCILDELNRYMLDDSSWKNQRALNLLHSVHGRIAKLRSGDVIPSKYRFIPGEVSILTKSSFHLHELLHLTLEIFHIMLKRQISLENVGKIRYSVGDIVYDTINKCRGVVVAWDGTPRVDVPHGHRLVDIQDPVNKPFYHIIPDKVDCLEAFGNEGQTLYVCEENLEPCSIEQRSVDVDLDPDWKYNALETKYDPPVEVRFRYGENMKDDGLLESCMSKMKSLLNSWQYEAQKSTVEDLVFRKLSMHNLMKHLQLVDNINDASTVQDIIKEMRKAHPQEDLRRQLETGISELLDLEIKNALKIFRDIVRKDHNYVEAWNQTAKCEFISRQILKSKDSTNKVLELDPNHFPALNGLGLIHYEEGEYALAVDDFRKSLKLDPWSPASFKLASCLDLLSRQKR